jgi:hypothetical protein
MVAPRKLKENCILTYDPLCIYETTDATKMTEVHWDDVKKAQVCAFGLFCHFYRFSKP